jgi:hypothetical protein
MMIKLGIHGGDTTHSFINKVDSMLGITHGSEDDDKSPVMEEHVQDRNRNKKRKHLINRIKIRRLNNGRWLKQKKMCLYFFIA